MMNNPLVIMVLVFLVVASFAYFVLRESTRDQVRNRLKGLERSSNDSDASPDAAAPNTGEDAGSDDSAASRPDAVPTVSRWLSGS